ncbi:MAG TPA: tetratricopeptide repeat protein [Vicinamibacterales bacterium]
MKKPAVLVCVALLAANTPQSASPVSAQAIAPSDDQSQVVAQNAVGYAALRDADTTTAIAAFSEIARTHPQEPNAQDSLGEALMAAGRFKEAEAAFQRALALVPQFWQAHEGIAFARFYAGDLAGARQEWAKARELGASPANTFRIDADLAAAALAQNDTVEAIRILVDTAKAEGGDQLRVAATGSLLAETLIIAEQPREALGVVAEILKVVESGQLPPGAALNHRRNALRARVAAEALLGDVAAATKTSAALDADASSHAGEGMAQDAMHFGRGALASASGNWAAARAQFDQCGSADLWCRWHGVIAAQKAGDRAGAATARDALLKLYLRSSGHMIIRARLTNIDA